MYCGNLMSPKRKFYNNLHHIRWKCTWHHYFPKINFLKGPGQIWTIIFNGGIEYMVSRCESFPFNTSLSAMKTRCHCVDDRNPGSSQSVQSPMDPWLNFRSNHYHQKFSSGQSKSLKRVVSQTVISEGQFLKSPDSHFDLLAWNKLVENFNHPDFFVQAS